MTFKAPLHTPWRLWSSEGLTPSVHDWRSSGGFTMLEIAFVLFLMVRIAQHGHSEAFDRRQSR